VRVPHEPEGSPRPALLLAHLRRHVMACRLLGSPIYSGLLAHAVEDFRADGPTAAAFEGYAEDPVRSAAAMRLLGTVHRFALAGQAPDLARYYPSVRGAAADPFDADRAWAAFRDVVATRLPEVREGVRRPPQTNEINRGVGLAGGLLRLAERFDLPVRLVELGASAGLNLRPDLLRIDLPDGTAFGPVDSPVRLHADWSGNHPQPGPIRVVERLAFDKDPVDVATEDGRLRLTSYVWPDQIERLALLRDAFDLAAVFPVEVHRARAGDALADVDLADGALTVVWHSLFWQYLDDAERAEVTALLDAVGERAAPGRPLARLSLEPRGRRSPEGVEFLLRVQTWPGAGVEVLGVAHPHSAAVLWS
jgi:hypothetical protein